MVFAGTSLDRGGEGGEIPHKKDVVLVRNFEKKPKTYPRPCFMCGLKSGDHGVQAIFGEFAVPKSISLVSCNQWPVYLASLPNFFALQDIKPTKFLGFKML